MVFYIEIVSYIDQSPTGFLSCRNLILFRLRLPVLVEVGQAMKAAVAAGIMGRSA